MKRALVLFVGLLFLACSSPDANERVDPGIAQSGADFYPVSLVIVDRCGSIDCHGSKYRNMRIYGYGSSRLDPSHRPDSPEMTQAEADRNYDAIAALEPDLFRQVIVERGADPERLTFIRKGRGREDHKGNTKILAGDPADLCIQSWLQSKVDAAGCQAAVPRLTEKK